MKKLRLAAIGLMVCGIAPVYGGQNPPPSIQPIQPIQLNKTISLSESYTVTVNARAGSASASGVETVKYSGQVQTSQVRTPPAVPAWPSP